MDTKPSENKCCIKCGKNKIIDEFLKNRNTCKECNNDKRRLKYKNDEEHRERDEPLEKFKRSVRSRIHKCLQKKTKHTIEYLGCNSQEYLKWLLTNNSGFTLNNRGSDWHIDHVIPLSKFNLEVESEQLVAFNWRNTMPLSPEENLSKNNKIIIPQIEQHYKNLVDYHIKNNIEMPQIFIDLFARYLVAGIPLETSLLLVDGNIHKEHG